MTLLLFERKKDVGEMTKISIPKEWETHWCTVVVGKNPLKISAQLCLNCKIIPSLHKILNIQHMLLNTFHVKGTVARDFWPFFAEKIRSGPHMDRKKPFRAFSRTTLRKRKISRNRFCLFIRSPGGVFFIKRKVSKISWHCPLMIIRQLLNFCWKLSKL